MPSNGLSQGFMGTQPLTAVLKHHTHAKQSTKLLHAPTTVTSSILTAKARHVTLILARQGPLGVVWSCAVIKLERLSLVRATAFDGHATSQ